MKMKKCIYLVLIMTIAIVLVGCGKKSAGNEVVIYSPHGGDERGEYLAKKAKEEIGLDIKFVSGGGGTLVDRLLNEKDNPQADVGMALNKVFLYSLKKEGVLDAYKPSWLSDLDEEYYDKDGYFYGFGRTPEVLGYNVDWFNKHNIKPPTSWLDLAKDEYKGLYTLAPLENQTTRMYLAGILWRFYDPKTKDISEEGWNTLKKIYRNAYTVEQIDYEKVKDGTTPIFMDWYGGALKNCETYGINAKYVEEKTGTMIVAESLTLIKGGPNQENAKKFIEWFGSAEVQADYAEKFFSYGQVPLNKKALELVNDKIKNAAKMFTKQKVDEEIISEKLNSWVKKIELEIAK